MRAASPWPNARRSNPTTPLLCVVAGAGAGKTRVLTLRVARRVREGTIEPDRTLVTTFSRKAADELRTRLRSLGVSGVKAGTFHRTALGLLHEHRELRGRPQPQLLPDRRRLLADVTTGDARRTARPRRRDRVGQGAPRAPRAVRVRGASAPSPQRHQSRPGRRCLCPLRGGADPPPAARLRRPHRRLCRRPGWRQQSSPTPSAGAPATSSSTRCRTSTPRSSAS